MMEEEDNYDCLLKFLIVGDDDVGKNEIISGLDDTEEEWKDYIKPAPILILIEGKRVRLNIMNISLPQCICQVLNRRLRGAHGIVLIYDITSKQSFKQIDGWLKTVEKHAHSVPKFLIGNRLHLEFRREVDTNTAELYASKNNMIYFELSPIYHYNSKVLFTDLAKLAFKYNGLERMFSHKVLSLQELCCRRIGKVLSTDDIDTLSLPESITLILKSFAFKHSRKPAKQRNICTIV